MKYSINNHLEDLLHNLPASIYWKNKDGVYLGRNHFAAKKMLEYGYEDKLDLNLVIGKSDFDFFHADVAEHFRKNDKSILQSNQERWYKETNVLPNGRTLHQISCKKPWRNQYNEVIGIIGVTFDSPMLIQPRENKISLSRQQKNCLYYLMHGGTTKTIAISLGLSPRTVEHYLEAIKEKLDCKNRTELISKARMLGIEIG